MEFNRLVYRQLIDWRNKEKRKPLLLMGARQVGKTTVLKAFGNEEYENLLYINLEKQKDVHSFFKGNIDPQKILRNLSLLFGSEISASDTLIILDEIQECKEALTALKYFAKEAPKIHIIGAGSLLGLHLGQNSSFPVGKVEFLHMYPLTFMEYLEQADSKMYKVHKSIIEERKIENINEAFFRPLKLLHKDYLLFGGMPEVAATYLLNKSIDEAQKIQDQILQSYALDFAKHAVAATSTKIRQIWNSIPSQLARENKKFIYKLIKSGARARAYEEAVQWLIQAGLLYKVSRVEVPNVPLKAYEDISSYKLYVFETGLLMRLAGLNPKIFIDEDLFFKEFKGAIAENYVAQSFQFATARSPYYWTSNGKAEVDFIFEHLKSCIPVEVKSGDNTKSKSLAVYAEKYQPKLRVRISNLNLTLDNDFLNLPLFLAEKIDVILGKVLHE